MSAGDPLQRAMEAVQVTLEPLVVDRALAERVVQAVDAAFRPDDAPARERTSEAERREALVRLVFEHYWPVLPNGQPMPGPERWPLWFVEAIASTPPLFDLDRKIEFGARALAHASLASWQAESS